MVFRQISIPIAGNGLQAWEVADASELSSIGKIDFFREKQTSGY